MNDNRVLTLKEDLIEIADAIRTKKNLKGDLTFSQLKANTLEAINTSEYNEYYTKDISTWDTLNVDNFEKALTFPNTLLIHSNGIDVYYKEDNGLYHYNTATKVSTFLCSSPEEFYFHTSMESSNGTAYIQYCYSSSPYNSTFYKISGTTIIKTYEGVSLREGKFYETKKGDVYAYYDYYSSSTYCYYRRIVHLGDEATLLGPFGDKFFETSEGDLYVGENKDTGGLYYLNGNTLTKLCGEKGSNWLYYYETHNKDFYISGIKNFVHVAKDTVTLLAGGGINVFFETSKGTLYVGCDGAGGRTGIAYVNGPNLVTVRQNSSEGDSLGSFGWYIYEANNDNVYAHNWDVDGLWFLSEDIATKVLSGIYNRDYVTFYTGKDGYSYLTLNQNHPGLYVIDKANTTQLRTSGYWNTEVLNTEEGLFLLLSGTLLKVYQGEVTELQTSLGSTDEIFKLNSKTLFTVRTSANSVITKHLYYLANSQLKTVISAKWNSDYRNWSINLFESSDGTLYVSSTFANSNSFGWRGIYAIQSNLTITKVYNGDTNYLFYETSNGFVYASPFPRTDCVVNGGIVKLSPTAGKQIYAEGLGWIPRAEKDTKILFSTSDLPDTKDDIALVVDGDTVHRLLLTKSIGSYIEPEGTLNITENGEYDVTNYEKTNVTIPIPEGYIKPEGTLNITENGEYQIADKNFVSVAVPVSSGTATVVEKVPTWQEIKTNSFLNVAVRDYVFESSDGKYRYSSYGNSTSALTREKGLFRLDLTTGEEVKLHNDYYCWQYFFEASNGDTYIGLSSSLSTDNRGIFRIRNGVLTQIYTDNHSWEYFFEASNGNIYVSSGSSTGQGILLIKDDSVTKIYTTSYSWQYFFEDNAGNIYVSSTKSNTGIVHIKEDIATLAYSSSAKWCYFHLDAKEGVYASSSNSSTGIVYLKDSVGTKIYTTGYNWQTSYSRKNGGVYVAHSSYSLLLLQGETVTPVEPQLKTLGSFTVEDDNGVYIGGGTSLTGIYYLQDATATQIFTAGTAYDLLKTTSGDIYASGYKIPLLHLQNGVVTTLSDTTAYNFSRFYEAKNGYTYTSQTSGKFMALKGTTAVTLSGGGYKLPNVFEASTGCLYFSCDENNNLGVYKVDGTTSVNVYSGGYNYKYFHESPNGDIYASSASGNFLMRIRGNEGKMVGVKIYPFPYSCKVGDGLLLCKTQYPQPSKDVCLLIEGDTINHVLLNNTIQRS